LPVIVSIDRSQLTARGGTGEALGTQGFEQMIARGMRAELNTESQITGLLFIDLDFHPNTPLQLQLQPGGPYREIPTVPTTLESVLKQVTDAFKKLDQIDFKGLLAAFDSAADSINNLASSPNLQAALVSLQRSTLQLDKTLDSMRVAINNINAHVDPLAAGLQKHSTELSQTLLQTRAALADGQGLLDPDSPTVVNLNQALVQLNQTTRSLTSFTDYLERNPSALIRGSYVPEKDR
jgi:paraquat-inducible protein B